MAVGTLRLEEHRRRRVSARVVAVMASSRDAAWRRRPGRATVITALLLLLGPMFLLPVFKSNILNTPVPEFFSGWQQDSEALVLAKIESTWSQSPPGIPNVGLVATLPEQLSPIMTLDTLYRGARPNTDSYVPYQSQLGLQGYAFAALNHLGFHSLTSLWTVNSAMTAFVLVLFAVLLASVTRRSFAAVLLAVAVGSPWFVAAARNLYWVPWTWFLPACAAIWLIRARGRWRIAALIALFVAVALRCGTGFEFLTSIVLMAAGVPVLAHVLGPRPSTWRRALKDALTIFAVSVGAFVVSVGVLAVVIGRGDALQGLQIIWLDATSRTYGSTSTDPLIAASQAASLPSVLGSYVLGWSTDIIAFGVGSPLSFQLGPVWLYLLLAGAVAVVLVRFARADPLWRRDAVVFALGIAVPFSWFVAAKGHAFVHRHIDYVLWYLMGIGSLIWVIAAFVLPIGARLIGGHEQGRGVVEAR